MAQQGSHIAISSAILLLLSLYASSCLSSVVPSSAGVSLAYISKTQTIKDKSNDPSYPVCSVDSDCPGRDPHCWIGMCYSCENDELWNGLYCEEIDTGLVIGVAIVLFVGIPLVVIAAITACCFCCPCCPGHKCRQRRKQPPTQIVVAGSYGYDQQGNVVQYAYGAPPATNPHNPNNIPAPYANQNQAQHQEQNADTLPQEKLNE